MSGNLKVCFVIMPFSKTTDKRTGSYWTKHFNSYLKPLIEENPALEARRSKAMRVDILKEIITDLALSHLVIADLTDLNANVFWELGVRQSFAHRTVTIAEKGTVLPFDVSTKGTLFYYPKNHIKNEGFRNDFKEAIQDCLANPDKPDSQVLETLSGRGTLFEIFRSDEAVRRIDAVLSECSRNLDTLNKLFELAKGSLGNDPVKGLDKSEFTTIRLISSATQLLTTNRYIDEDQSFFRLAEDCLVWFGATNAELSIWRVSGRPVESWLVRNIESVTNLIKEFETRVRAAREKLSRQF